MYIPTIFFGNQNDCIECFFSGSIIPDGITYGNINSDWAYIKVPRGKQVQFQTKTGVSSNAKMLVVGGGGYSQTYGGGGDGTGGGGAGEVIFQDFGIQPDIMYFASSSASGGTSGNQTGGSSIFIENYDNLNPSVWRQHTAVGGQSNTNADGGTSGNGFAGGTGFSDTAGGGGGGSTGVGENAEGGGTPDGGDGGDGYTIPSPFNSVVLDTGTKIAGGGPGKGQTTNGSYASGVDFNAYGNGGSEGNGKDGVVFIFLPITNCETGSREGLDFKAEGGTTGTFFSGSIQYKYHAFTDGSSSLGGLDTFNVTQGVTNEAKTFLIAGGAGKSAKNDSEVGAGDDICYQGGGGAAAGGVKINENVTLWGYSNQISMGEGGPRYTNGNNSRLTQFPVFNTIQATGGGRGAYQDDLYVPASGDANNGGSGGGGWNPIDNTGGSGTVGQGNDGGDGYSLGPGTSNKKAGGGGGGAGSAGSNAVSTGPGTPISSRYASGGSGYELDGTFWGFLTGSIFTARTDVAIGGSGSAGWYDSVTPGQSCPAPPAGGGNNSQTNDGSGASPNGSNKGNDGIIVITYPISGSVTNS